LTQRQYERAQTNGQPWHVRNIKDATGATLGATADARYLSARIRMLGPFGILLGAGGSMLGHALTHDIPITVAGGVGGELIRMTLWHFVAPPPQPTTPDSPVDLPIQHFMTDEQRGEVQHRHFLYGNLNKAVFVLDGRQRCLPICPLT
jgi:hypothetical protein